MTHWRHRARASLGAGASAFVGGEPQPHREPLSLRPTTVPLSTYQTLTIPKLAPRRLAHHEDPHRPSICPLRGDRYRYALMDPWSSRYQRRPTRCPATTLFTSAPTRKTIY